MNPQLNKVFSKLAKEDKKTELKSEKVELMDKKAVNKYQKEAEALIDKAESLGGKLDDEILNIQLKIDEAFKAAKQAEKAFAQEPKLYKEIKDFYRFGQILLSQLELEAKDLGLDFRDSKLYDIFEKYESKIRTLESKGISKENLDSIKQVSKSLSKVNI